MHKKKAVLITLIVLIVCAFPFWVMYSGSVYVQNIKIHTPERVLTLFLKPSGIKKWWPGAVFDKNTLTFNGFTYNFNQPEYSRINSIVDSEVSGDITYFSLSNNENKVNWTTSISKELNPIKRIKSFLRARKIDQTNKILLNRLKTVLEDNRNIYGMEVQYTRVKDTLLVSSKKHLDHNPQETEVYEQINNIFAYIKRQGAVAKGYPMVNITRIKKADYLITTAIPVDKRIPANGAFEIKKMIPGNLLKAKITGGRKSVENGLEQMENYIRDNRHISPAIPFQELITNRITQPDTSKWVTEIYYPIF